MSQVESTQVAILQKDIKTLKDDLVKLDSKISQHNQSIQKSKDVLDKLSKEKTNAITKKGTEFHTNIINNLTNQINILTGEKNVKTNDLACKEKQLQDLQAAITARAEPAKFTNTTDTNMFNHLLVLIVLIILILCVLIYCLSDSLAGKELNF